MPKKIPPFPQTIYCVHGATYSEPPNVLIGAPDAAAIITTDQQPIGVYQLVETATAELTYAINTNPPAKPARSKKAHALKNKTR